MSRYGGYIGGIVSGLESSTMSRHLQGYENNYGEEGRISQRIQDEVESEDLKKFSKFIPSFENALVFSSLNVEKDSNALEFAEYLGKKLTNLNEYCLQDREFSEAIVKGCEYSKEFFSKTKDGLSIEAIVATGYRKRVVRKNRYGVDNFTYKLDYLPSKTDEEPNIIRFSFSCMDYSAIVDICSNGELICRDATKMQIGPSFDEFGEAKYSKTQVKCSLDDIFQENLYFASTAMDGYKEFFMKVFEKADLLTMGKQK